ncbi:MAG TPA: hypothetical protein VLA68_01530, partial [Nitrososphaera sp.]|nr:hypothetical protein [Nitrososphaera sp.]
MAPSLNAIISIELGAPRCRKILSGDGITSPDLTIKKMQGICEGVSIDARSTKKALPAIGDACSVAKNLDEYQFLICSLVPTLADSNPSKLQLQKYRVMIIAAFARLASVLREANADELLRWNKHAGSLLEEASEAYLKARSNSDLQVTKHKEAFDFFGMPEAAIEAALRAF